MSFLWALKKFTHGIHFQTNKQGMSSTDTTILADAKQYIECGDLSGIQYVWKSLDDYEFEEQPDWVYLFQKLYLHACLKRQPQIADWLQHVLFPQMDPIQQIALRQVFSYGNYLLRRKK